MSIYDYQFSANHDYNIHNSCMTFFTPYRNSIYILINLMMDLIFNFYS